MQPALPPDAVFAHCPRCGGPARARDSQHFDCPACGFHLHFNACVAVAALIIRDDGYLLFIRRARDPGKGKLALPGGFVDPHERAEVAVVREVEEEVGLALTDLTFQCTQPNLYAYKGLLYPVCDLFFTARPAGELGTLAPTEVSAICWEDPRTLDVEMLAFPSMRAALTLYRAGLE